MATVAEPEQPISDGVAVGEKDQGTQAPLQAPIETPTPQSRPAPHAELKADQQKKYDWLLQKVKGWDKVGNPKHPESSRALDDSERQWLTRDCLLRYLRATKWREAEAEKRLIETLVWRREYDVDGLTPEHISPENATGKQVILGYDKSGRPCQYLNPGRQNTDVSPRQVQHLVFMVERVIELMPPGQETLALLINFKQSKNRSNTAPGIGQGREVLHILQTHYPERLGKALIINVPWIVWGFFKLITPFIDPLTREKLKFNEDMTQYVPAEQLWTEYPGGLLQFDYDHSVYWPALIKLSKERKDAQTAKWIAGGKQIGEHEDYLKGLVEHGVGLPAATEPAKAEVPLTEAPAKGQAVEEQDGEAKDEAQATKAEADEPAQTASDENGTTA